MGKIKASSPSKRAIRCARCRRRYRNPHENDGWNATVKRGVVIGYLCPDCQTPEENAEAAINEATTNYSTDAFGRYVGTSKADD